VGIKSSCAKKVEKENKIEEDEVMCEQKSLLWDKF